MAIDIFVQDEHTNVESDGIIIKGDSAYEVAVKRGFKGTEEEWLATLNGIHVGPEPPTTDSVEVWVDTDANNGDLQYTEKWLFERPDGQLIEKTVILNARL